MNNQEQKAYFEQLATQYRPIGHTRDAPRFCRYNMDEVVTGLRQNLDLSQYCLLLEAPTGTLENNQGDGNFDNQEIAFMVIRMVEERNFDEEEQVLSESRRMGVQLLARIIEQGEFADLDLDSIEYDKIGPVFGNCFGYRYTITAVSEISLATDPAEWDE